MVCGKLVKSGFGKRNFGKKVTLRKKWKTVVEE
jgi:hypothetical protein